MPELPEVQTVVNDLNAAGFVGAVISRARVFWPRTISGISAAAFETAIKGRRVGAVRRRGKFVVFDLAAGGALLIHLRMSGRLSIARPSSRRTRHEHVILDFSDGRQLRFYDTRKFGRFYLLDDPAGMLKNLGPEPLAASFRSSDLAGILKGRRRMIKPLLLDQSAIAGLGNIYADEALWEARIHPTRIADSLDKSEVHALYRAIRKVLRKGLRNMGTTLGNGSANFYSIAGYNGRNRDQLKVFRRTGAPCSRCGEPIRRLVVGQRSTHVCPRCQKQQI